MQRKIYVQPTWTSFELVWAYREGLIRPNGPLFYPDLWRKAYLSQTFYGVTVFFLSLRTLTGQREMSLNAKKIVFLQCFSQFVYYKYTWYIHNILVLNDYQLFFFFLSKVLDSCQLGKNLFRWTNKLENIVNICRKCDTEI